MEEIKKNNEEQDVQMVSEPIASMQFTGLSPAQIEVLNAVAWLKSDEEIRELQHVISEFFANRADEAMEQLWSEGTWNEQTLADLKKAHYRTPYFIENLPI